MPEAQDHELGQLPTPLSLLYLLLPQPSNQHLLLIDTQALGRAHIET